MNELDAKLNVLKTTIAHLYRIKESLRRNILRMETDIPVFANSPLVFEIEYIYIMFLINGVYKVLINNNRNGITISRLIDDLNPNKSNTVLNMLSDALHKIEKKHSNVLVERSRLIAHLDAEYIFSKDNHKIDGKEVLDAVEDVFQFFNRFLQLYYDDNSFSTIEIKTDKALCELINRSV
jgi:hypothetical protein